MVKVDVVFLEFPQEVSISVPDFIFLSPHKVRGFLCVCLCSQLSPSEAHHSLMLLVWWSSLLVEDKSLTTSVLLFHVPFWSPKRSISLSGNHISSILVYVAKSTVATSQDLLTFMCVTRIQPAFLLLLLTEHLHCSLKICHAASKSEVHQRKVIVF